MNRFTQILVVCILQEIQTHYDEVHRQLQVTVDQYGVAQRKLQTLTSELEEIRSNYEVVSALLSPHIKIEFSAPLGT
jgi:septation ring formation regulator EzrA